MTDTLFIRLSSSDPAQPVEATVVSANESVVRPAFSTTLESLATSYAHLPVIGLIPGFEALTTTAVLPKSRAGQFRKMLPFALEEQIAGELDHQHFAMGRPTPRPDSSPKDGLSVPVIVIRRETIDAYLSALRAAGFEPVKLHLDESCIAAKPGDVIAWVQGDEIFLRSPSGAGLRCYSGDLSTTLAFLPADPPLATLGLQIVGLPLDDDAKLNTAPLKQRFSTVFSAHSADHVLNWLVAQRTLADPINLLQGELAPRHSRTWLDARWKLPAALAAVLFLLVTLDHANTWRVLAAEEAALDLAIAQGGGQPRSSLPLAQSILRRALVDLANAGLRDGAIVAIVQEAGVIRVTLASDRGREAAVQSLSSAGWRIDSGTDQQGRLVLTMFEAAGGAE